MALIKDVFFSAEWWFIIWWLLNLHVLVICCYTWFLLGGWTGRCRCAGLMRSSKGSLYLKLIPKDESLPISFVVNHPKWSWTHIHDRIAGTVGAFAGGTVGGQINKTADHFSCPVPLTPHSFNVSGLVSILVSGGLRIISSTHALKNTKSNIGGAGGADLCHKMVLPTFLSRVQRFWRFGGSLSNTSGLLIFIDQQMLEFVLEKLIRIFRGGLSLSTLPESIRT